MLRWRVGVIGTVYQEDGNPDLRRGGHRAHGIDVELTSLLGNAERPIDDPPREEERRALGGNGPDIGERFCGDHGGYAGVTRRFLQRPPRPQRGGGGGDRPPLRPADYFMQITRSPKTLGGEKPRR